MKEKDIIAQVDVLVKEILDDTIPQYQKAGERAMKKIRDDIVDEWFREFDSESMKNATIYGSNLLKRTKDSATISVFSYVSPSLYNHEQNAQGWYTRHEDEIKMKMEPEEYVLDLQLNKGIVGLPEKGKYSEWENPKFHQYEPLFTYLNDHPMWKLWSVYVNKYL